MFWVGMFWVGMFWAVIFRAGRLGLGPRWLVVRGRCVRVPMGLFAVMARVVGNLVTQIVRMLARIRTAARASSRPGRCAGVGWYVRRGSARIGCGARFVRFAVRAGLGKVVRAIIFVLFRLFCPRRRNLPHDFIGLGRIRIHDGSHRDVQVITIARGRRLRKGRRSIECKDHREKQPSRGFQVGVTAEHAMSPMLPRTWATRCHPATDTL